MRDWLELNGKDQVLVCADDIVADLRIENACAATASPRSDVSIMRAPASGSFYRILNIQNIRGLWRTITE
jgi:hypothetical protein